MHESHPCDSQASSFVLCISFDLGTAVHHDACNVHHVPVLTLHMPTAVISGVRRHHSKWILRRGKACDLEGVPWSEAGSQTSKGVHIKFLTTLNHHRGLIFAPKLLLSWHGVLDNGCIAGLLKTNALDCNHELAQADAI